MAQLYIKAAPKNSSKLLFTGRILPEFIKVSLGAPETQWKLPEQNIDMTFELTAKEGAITVECLVGNYDEKSHLFLAALRSYDHARAAVDLAAFATGRGLSVIFDHVTLPDGTTKHLHNQEEALAALSTSVVPNNGNYDAVMQMVIQDLRVSKALHDLIDSITTFHSAQTACARAVEALRHTMAPKLPRKKQWGVFKKNLRLETSYIEPITNLATGPRHGDHIHIPGREIKDIQQRAWIIMNRYFEFCKLGRKDPLPLDRFPVLT
jgi:hypothetical protein